MKEELDEESWRAESEKRMKPLVDAASKDARHFVAMTMTAAIAVAKERYKSQEEADAAANKAMDEVFDSFCRAQCSAWRMMFAQMIENGVINPEVMLTPPEDENEQK